MSRITNIRKSVRDLITKWGSSATIYTFLESTYTTNEEGEDTVTDWGNGTAIKVVSSNNYSYRRLLESQGIESNSGERVFLIRDDVAVAPKDKIVIDSEAYVVDEIKRVDPSENVLILQRVVVSKDERYTA